jgi:hypothetical protein
MPEGKGETAAPEFATCGESKEKAYGERDRYISGSKASPNGNLAQIYVIKPRDPDVVWDDKHMS